MRGLGALDVHVHGLTITLGLRLVNVLLAVETAADVLAQALNDAHVLQPAVVLLLALASGIAGVRRLGRGRGGALAGLGGGSSAGRGLHGTRGSGTTSTLEHAARVAAALAHVKAGAKGSRGRLAVAVARSRQAGGKAGVHDRSRAVTRLGREARSRHAGSRGAGRVARRVGHRAGGRSDGGSAGGGDGSERRGHVGGRDRVVAVSHARRAAVHGVGGGSVAEAVAVVAAVVNLDTGGGVASVLIDGVLHLAQQVVNLDEVLLRSGVGHGQIVLLGKRVVRDGGDARAHAARYVGRLRHVLLGSGHGAVGNREGAMEGEKRAANVIVRRGVDVATLGAAKKVVDHVVGSLAVIASAGGSGVVANVLGAGSVHGRRVEIHAVVGRGLRSIVATGMARLGEAGGAGAHLAVVIIVAGGWREGQLVFCLRRIAIVRR